MRWKEIGVGERVDLVLGEVGLNELIEGLKEIEGGGGL